MDYIFRANRIYFYDKQLHHRRLRPNSIITNKNNRKHVNGITINNRMIEKIKQVGYYDYVKDEHKEYFYDCLKEDLDKHAEQIKNTLDFSLIDERTTFIFESILKSTHYWELELRIRCYDYEFKINELENINKKILEENKKLKKDLKNVQNKMKL